MLFVICFLTAVDLAPLLPLWVCFSCTATTTCAVHCLWPVLLPAALGCRASAPSLPPTNPPAHPPNVPQLVKDIQDALQWLDSHFTFTKKEVSGPSWTQCGLAAAPLLLLPPQWLQRQACVAGRHHACSMPPYPQTRPTHKPHPLWDCWLVELLAHKAIGRRLSRLDTSQEKNKKIHPPPHPPPLQVEMLAHKAIGRRLSRLDTSLYKMSAAMLDPTKKNVRPC